MKSFASLGPIPDTKLLEIRTGLLIDHSFYTVALNSDYVNSYVYNFFFILF